MGKIVYVVTSGIYSDYKINAVFSSKKLAEEYVKKYKLGYNDGEIKEFKLDSKELNIPNLSLFKVKMTKDGAPVYVERVEEKYGYDEYVEFALEKKMFFIQSEAISNPVLEMYVFARDEKHECG